PGATPTLARPWTRIARSVHVALSIGGARTISARARTNTGSGETQRSRRTPSSAVHSTVRNVVTCGIAATSVSRSATARRIGETGTSSMGVAEPTDQALAGSPSGSVAGYEEARTPERANPSTSPRVIRPPPHAHRESELRQSIPAAYEATEVRREVYEVLYPLHAERGPFQARGR